MATRVKKTWGEKLIDAKGLPKVEKITKKMRARWGAAVGETMVIPAPVEVDAVMKRVPAGKVVTINVIRAVLAKRHGVAITCPLTTGIFAWIAAHAAAEALAAGRRKVTPYWRTLKNGGEINPKFPGGAAEVRKRLRAEGHKVVKKGERYFVWGFERALATLA